MESMNFVYFTFFPLPSYRKPKKHFQEVPKPLDLIFGTVWEIQGVRNMIPDISEYCIHPNVTVVLESTNHSTLSILKFHIQFDSIEGALQFAVLLSVTCTSKLYC